MVTEEEIQSVATLNLHDPASAAIPLAQTKHRFDIVSGWDISPGSRILELGCGQGDCTTVLSHVVGPNGHVTAVDPGPIETYGSPYTLAQSQNHISTGRLGSRITWIEADPIAFLDSHPEDKYDYAVLTHCIWYFASPTTLENTLRALSPHTNRIAIAEWALLSSSPNAIPHILAAFAKADLHWRQPGQGNIRTLLSPEAIKTAGAKCGLTVEKERLIIPAPELQDARWEVSEVVSPHFLDNIDKAVASDRERCVLHALRDSVISSKSAVLARGKRVQCMDVWVGVFVVN
ncbi:S-adenosyl-L-methionine-dependent methyltransferase [Ramaria rubella]|nr:S-adenosyl-L-methionine-dependent methyltransferase [Ramaria rubella]